jgi:hypothetical protein
MSTYDERRDWRWLAIPFVGAAAAWLGTVLYQRGASPHPRTSLDETSEEAALAVATGAMADEGGPADRHPS